MDKRMAGAQTKPARWLPDLVLAGLVLWLARSRAGANSWLGLSPVWAVGLVLLVEGYQLWRQEKWSWGGLVATSPRWLLSLSVTFLIVLSPSFVAKAGLALVLWTGRSWLVTRAHEDKAGLVLAALNQFAGLAAIFLAAAVWRIPTALVIVLAWAISWLVARRLLAPYRDPAAAALAATWALIVSQCAWVFSLWLVNYIVLGGLAVVPQPAVVLTALGYCLAGTYVCHRQGSLNRGRLVEYVVIGLVILVVVALGTKWNGII